MTTTITTSLAELRERGACDKGIAFAESIAAPDGTITVELTPLWLESDRRRWLTPCGSKGTQTCAN